MVQREAMNKLCKSAVRFVGKQPQIGNEEFCPHSTPPISQLLRAHKSGAIPRWLRDFLSYPMFCAALSIIT